MWNQVGKRCPAARNLVQAEVSFSSTTANLAAVVSRLSLQFRVLRLGLLQERDVGVGVFPQREKSL
jgi:hypothetical protein